MEQNQFEIKNIELMEILMLVKNHIISIIITTIILAIGGFLYTKFFITPIYESSATLIVNTREKQSIEVTNDQINSAKNLVATYSIIIKSDTVLNPVIDNLGLKENYRSLLSKISVEPVNNTQVIKISARDADPQKAKDIITELVKIVPDIIIETVEAGSVKTISLPSVNNNPVSPNIKINTLIAAFLGVFLSVGLYVLKHIIDNTFKTEFDVQKQLDLPVLGIIPSIESCRNSKNERYIL